MRRTLILLVASFALLPACTEAIPDANRPPVTTSPGDSLLLTDGDGLAAVDARSGAIRFELGSVVASPDWSGLYQALPRGGRTVVTRFSPADGVASDPVTVRGTYEIWAASNAGDAVALMAPLPPGADRWEPPSRAFTDIVVVDPADVHETMSFHLRGNFVPEAFSPNGESLFLLQYRPALAPTSYRVTSLYLEKGKVWPVFGPDKQLVENMTGTRLIQTPSANGSALFTLYSNQPSDYLVGGGADPGNPLHDVAFVHTLMLRDGFAHCMPLPRGFGKIPAGGAAIAVSPVELRVFAIDAVHGTVATFDTDQWQVESSKVALGTLGAGGTAAIVSPDGSTLYVMSAGAEPWITAIDAGTLEVTGTWPLEMSSATSTPGMGFASDGSRLWIGSDGSVASVDPDSGHELGTFEIPGTQSLDHVLAA